MSEPNTANAGIHFKALSRLESLLIFFLATDQI